MEALILLLISICLLTTYGFIYVASRLIKERRKELNDPFYRISLLFLAILVASGSCAAVLIIYS